MRYHFLEFLLDTDRFELYRNETRLAAEPQVIELLTLLLEQRQRVRLPLKVRRREEDAWPPPRHALGVDKRGDDQGARRRRH